MKINKGINVVSFFDGCSAGQLALFQLGIKVNNYFAYEIDKFAIQVTNKNFPNTKQMGDVRNFNAKHLPKIDLFIGGSPCTGFSFAGKGLNFEDPQSKLFFNYVDALNELREINPDIQFFLENVNMKKEYLRIISEHMGIFGQNLNSNLVSAQNRNRWYWSNIKTKKAGLFSEIHTCIPTPNDRKIYLKDIIQSESEIDEKYYIKNPIKGFEGMDINKKGKTLRVGGQISQTKKHNYDIIKLDRKLNLKTNQNKSSCLTGGGHSGGNHSDMDIICVSMVGRKLDKNGIRKDNDKNIKAIQQLEPNMHNKTNYLTSVQKDNLILTKNYIQLDISGKGYKSQQDRYFYENGKHGTLPASSDKNGVLLNSNKLRRLTPIECERLQTFPDNYTEGVSHSQRYKMMGNSWTVEIIKEYFKYIN